MAARLILAMILWPLEFPVAVAPSRWSPPVESTRAGAAGAIGDQSAAASRFGRYATAWHSRRSARTLGVAGLSTIAPGGPATLTKKKAALANGIIPGASARTFLLHDYEFTPPQGWRVIKKPDHTLLTQNPEETGCVIQILPPQPSSGDLERDVWAMWDLMYPGWHYQRSGQEQYTLSRGVLPKGLEYRLLEAPMSGTDAGGRYHLEEGAAWVIRAGSQVALVAVRHRGLLAHNDCVRDYRTWRRFFNSFTVRQAPPAPGRAVDAGRRLVGVWSHSESGASNEYVFAANGRFGRVGALGSASTSRDSNHEYLHLRTSAFAGDGSFTVVGDELTLQSSAGAEKIRIRFEEVNHGGTGWRDRVWMLRTDAFGENEVCLEKKPEARAPSS